VERGGDTRDLQPGTNNGKSGAYFTSDANVSVGGGGVGKSEKGGETPQANPPKGKGKVEHSKVAYAKQGERPGNMSPQPDGINRQKGIFRRGTKKNGLQGTSPKKGTEEARVLK